MYYICLWPLVGLSFMGMFYLPPAYTVSEWVEPKLNVCKYFLPRN